MSATVALLTDLMRCPSITPEDAGCQDIIAKRLSASNFSMEKLNFANVTNLWARRGAKPPLVVFAGHTDVVPPGPLDLWRNDPFTPTLHDGYLFGRGAADMKGGLAAMIIAAENFLKKHPDFPGSLAFLITSDEEGASLNGTKKVIETLCSRNIHIDYCIIGEATSEKEVGDQIRIGRRGSLHGDLYILGKQGHVAFPEKAANAIHLALAPLRALTQEIWDKGNAMFPPTTFQISNIQAGTGAANVIPGQLHVLFNFRFGTASTVTNLQDKVEYILKKHGLAYKIQWNLSAEPFVTQKGKLIAATVKAIEKTLARRPNLSTGGGTSDGRFIAPLGTQVLELGPCHHSVHEINECVRISDLEELTLAYEAILTELFF